MPHCLAPTQEQPAADSQAVLNLNGAVLNLKGSLEDPAVVTAFRVP